MQASIAGAQPQHNKSLVGGTVSAFRPEKKWTYSHTLGPPPKKKWLDQRSTGPPNPNLDRPPPPPPGPGGHPDPQNRKKVKIGLPEMRLRLFWMICRPMNTPPPLGLPLTLTQKNARNWGFVPPLGGPQMAPVPPIYWPKVAFLGLFTLSFAPFLPPKTTKHSLHPPSPPPPIVPGLAHF